MSPVSPNERHAARRRALQQALQARRDALGKKKRRRWWLLLALLLLLLLLLRLCSCETPPPAPVEPALSGTGAPSAPVVVPPPPTPLEGSVARRPRPSYETAPPAPLPWIASFRSQVAARSPRLSACFVGMVRPGRLKWTAAVEPFDGRVSDHGLEPTLQSEALSREQRECVIAVLSDPPYRLEAGQAPSTPSRVSMVIEF